MGKRYLEIIAELRENITDKADKMEKALDRVDRQITRMAGNWKRLGRDIQQVGNQIAIAGAAISGPMLLAFNQSAQFSQKVSDQIDRLKNVTTQFQLSVANALVPVMERFTNILGNLLQHWNALNPALREQIIQATFLTGIYISMGGVLLSLTGRLIKFAGEFVLLTQKFLAFAAVHPVLFAIAAGILVIVLNFEKLRDVAIPVLNAIELGVSTVAIGFHKLAGAVQTTVASMAGSLAKLYEIMAMIPGPQQALYKSLVEGLRGVEKHLLGVVDSRNKAIESLEANVTNILSKGKGTMVSVVEGGLKEMTRMKKMIDEIFSKPINISGVQKTYSALRDLTAQTAQGMTSTMGSIFFDGMTNRFRGLREIAANWGQQFLKIISTVLAKMVLIRMFGGVSIGGQLLGNLFHNGGMIQRAHNGMLAHDEVPIIAQTGEAVLSRRGVRAMGTENVHRANAGFGPTAGGQSGGTGSVTYVIQATDAQSFIELLSKNKAAIHQLVTANIERNGRLRQAIKKHI